VGLDSEYLLLLQVCEKKKRRLFHGFEDENWITRGMAAENKLTCALKFPISNPFAKKPERRKIDKHCTKKNISHCRI
jgi:hypothetical protein